MNLCEAFQKTVANFPNRIAVKLGVEQLTYSELNDRSNVVAKYLIKKALPLRIL